MADMTKGEVAYVSLRDHFEAIIREQQKAIEQANIEREKAASILRSSLIEKVQTGDAALDRHIKEQVAQITSMIEGQGRLVSQAHTSSQLAIAKAEEATEKRLGLLNEFRAQQADESKKYALRETVDSLTAQVSKIWGGLIVVAMLGVANLVKLFFAH